MIIILYNIIILDMFVDGYPMQDVIMKWRGQRPSEAVHGVDEAEIPQFTIMEYRTISTVEKLATGKSALSWGKWHITPFSKSMQL